MLEVFVFIGGFLLGSVPGGLILCKAWHGVDLRQYGSKNIGATNAYRVLGAGPGFMVLAVDMVKGMLGVYLGHDIIGTPLAELLGGIAAMAGHNWSIFLNFKGGRGVAAGLGVIAVLVPKVTVIVFLVWAVIVVLTRYVSLASIVAAGLVPVSMWLLGIKNEFLLFGVVAALFTVVRHRPNIERLIAGTEPKIKAKRAAAPKKEQPE